MPVFPCPHCHTSLTCKDDQVGNIVACGACGRKARCPANPFAYEEEAPRRERQAPVNDWGRAICVIVWGLCLIWSLAHLGWFLLVVISRPLLSQEAMAAMAAVHLVYILGGYVICRCVAGMLGER